VKLSAPSVAVQRVAVRQIVTQCISMVVFTHKLRCAALVETLLVFLPAR